MERGEIMQKTAFHVYCKARELENLYDKNDFAPVFSASDIKAYPFQIAAARFAYQSPYQKGVILCDESGMGKTHEALIVASQCFYEGRSRILIAIPNKDLLSQWVDIIEHHYSFPYNIIATKEQYLSCLSDDCSNPFDNGTIVLTTYDFAVENAEELKSISWDMTIFEEANALSPVYKEESKNAKKLYEIAQGSFKILLTGTPIEKNIMDLYGLIYFIDNSILENEQEFLKRYLRKPENYPELSNRVKKYCFRTLRCQAKQYAKVTRRNNIAIEYAQSPKERKIYDMLFEYCKKENKVAFPEMNEYDLSLRLLGLQSSSTKAILQTINGIIERLASSDNAGDELVYFSEMKSLCEEISIDQKTKCLISVIKKIFKHQKETNAKRKVVIFTESAQTQKYLHAILSEKYNTELYGGTTDYQSIQRFKDSGEILLSTDNGAKGFNLEECSVVIHYDLLYNTLKMEQRINRVHRLGQQNDVINIAFVDANNFSDVRKLELSNKRMLVSDGVFGLSDKIIGGFTGDIEEALSNIEKRTAYQIEAEYLRMLNKNQEENQELVSETENILFTTFTKDVYDKVKIAPKYIDEKSKQIENDLWEITKHYFRQYNENNNDCYYEIDEENKTITATKYEKLPVLFYYWSGGRNRKYFSQKSYGMAKDFKPYNGKITLTSIIGRGIINEITCAESGALRTIKGLPPCEIALYNIEVYDKTTLVKQKLEFVGMQEDKILSNKECAAIMEMPVADFTQSDKQSPKWLKGASKKHPLDNIVSEDEIITQYKSEISEFKQEEIERMKLAVSAKKAEQSRVIGDLELEIKKMEEELAKVTKDRMKTMQLERKLNLLRKDIAKLKDSQFFNEMKLDIELEEQIDSFLSSGNLSVKIERQFVLEVE